MIGRSPLREHFDTVACRFQIIIVSLPEEYMNRQFLEISEYEYSHCRYRVRRIGFRYLFR